MKKNFSTRVNKLIANISVSLFVVICLVSFSQTVDAGAPASAVASAVVEVTTSVVEAAVGATQVAVGTFASAVGGVLGNPDLGCQLVGTNGFTAVVNGGCSSGSIQTTVAPGSYDTSVTCTYGGTVYTTDTNFTCVTCYDGNTAVAASFCPVPPPVVNIQFHAQ